MASQTAPCRRPSCFWASRRERPAPAGRASATASRTLRTARAPGTPRRQGRLRKDNSETGWRFCLPTFEKRLDVVEVLRLGARTGSVEKEQVDAGRADFGSQVEHAAHQLPHLVPSVAPLRNLHRIGVVAHDANVVFRQRDQLSSEIQADSLLRHVLTANNINKTTLPFATNTDTLGCARSF